MSTYNIFLFTGRGFVSKKNKYKQFSWYNPLYYFHKLSDICVYISSASIFQNSILLCILVACVQVGVETSEQLVIQYSVYLAILNNVIIYVFSTECIIHVLAEDLYPWHYFTDPWNVFDITIVATSWIPGLGQFVMILRLLRLLRVLKLMHALPKLQVLA